MLGDADGTCLIVTRTELEGLAVDAETAGAEAFVSTVAAADAVGRALAISVCGDGRGCRRLRCVVVLRAGQCNGAGPYGKKNPDAGQDEPRAFLSRRRDDSGFRLGSRDRRREGLEIGLRPTRRYADVRRRERAHVASASNEHAIARVGRWQASSRNARGLRERSHGDVTVSRENVLHLDERLRPLIAIGREHAIHEVRQILGQRRNELLERLDVVPRDDLEDLTDVVGLGRARSRQTLEKMMPSAQMSARSYAYAAGMSVQPINTVVVPPTPN